MTIDNKMKPPPGMRSFSEQIAENTSVSEDLVCSESFALWVKPSKHRVCLIWTWN
jgi:hypothetical protein